MADFKFDSRLKVKTLQARFKKEFGATLRVYRGVNFADGELTIAALRGYNVKGEDFTCRGNMQVGTFIKKMKETFGITVKVADKDNKNLVSDNVTLSAAGK